MRRVDESSRRAPVRRSPGRARLARRRAAAAVADGPDRTLTDAHGPAKPTCP
ncbi:MAG: hypothetical protein MZW92_33415 [Comamonadaceae bacterium]|nr:hypothetical protein [Comamonadaceae bacterium]